MSNGYDHQPSNQVTRTNRLAAQRQVIIPETSALQISATAASKPGPAIMHERSPGR